MPQEVRPRRRNSRAAARIASHRSPAPALERADVRAGVAEAERPLLSAGRARL